MTGNVAGRTGRIHELTHNDVRLFKARLINIHQGNMRRLQRLTVKDIAENIFYENTLNRRR